MLPIEVSKDIVLRMPDLADAETLFYLIDHDREELGKWMPWTQTTCSAQDERHFIHYALDRQAHDQLWIVTIVVNNKPAGMIDIHEIDHFNKHGKIGYWLGQAFQGKGVMTRSLQAVEYIAFSILELHRLEVIADVANQRSRAVAERLSYINEGTMSAYLFVNGRFHDTILYAKIRSRASIR
ncbi:MAG: GNAT family protein [Sporolactobacillus sp.]